MDYLQKNDRLRTMPLVDLLVILVIYSSHDKNPIWVQILAPAKSRFSRKAQK